MLENLFYTKLVFLILCYLHSQDVIVDLLIFSLCYCISSFIELSYLIYGLRTSMAHLKTLYVYNMVTQNTVRTCARKHFFVVEISPLHDISMIENTFMAELKACLIYK